MSSSSRFIPFLLFSLISRTVLLTGGQQKQPMQVKAILLNHPDHLEEQVEQVEVEEGSVQELKEVVVQVVSASSPRP